MPLKPQSQTNKSPESPNILWAENLTFLFQFKSIVLINIEPKWILFLVHFSRSLFQNGGKSFVKRSKGVEHGVYFYTWLDYKRGNSALFHMKDKLIPTYFDSTFNQVKKKLALIFFSPNFYLIDQLIISGLECWLLSGCLDKWRHWHYSEDLRAYNNILPPP